MTPRNSAAMDLPLRTSPARDHDPPRGQTVSPQEPLHPGPGTHAINPEDAAEQAAARDYADTGARRAGATWHGPEWHRPPPDTRLCRPTPSWRCARANTTSQEGTHDGN